MLANAAFQQTRKYKQAFCQNSKNILPIFPLSLSGKKIDSVVFSKKECNARKRNC